MEHALSTLQFLDHEAITMEDIHAISQGIIEENKKNPHMLQELPESIFACVKRYGGMVAKTVDGQLAGFIKLSLLDAPNVIYERWSLFVLPEFRKHGIGKTLIYTITERYAHLAMLAVTNVPAVIAVNSKHSGQVELARSVIPKKLLEIIEGPQALLTDDRVFVNTTLQKRIDGGGLG